MHHLIIFLIFIVDLETWNLSKVEYIHQIEITTAYEQFFVILIWIDHPRAYIIVNIFLIYPQKPFVLYWVGNTQISARQ